MANQTDASQVLSKEKQPNQFGLGLLLGFFVGSTSYFLFKTKEGGELRDSFAEKWQETAQEFPSLAELKFGDMKLEELIDLLLGKKLPASTKGSGLQIKDASRKSSKAKANNPKKFTGV